MSCMYTGALRWETVPVRHLCPQLPLAEHVEAPCDSAHWWHYRHQPYHRLRWPQHNAASRWRGARGHSEGGGSWWQPGDHLRCRGGAGGWGMVGVIYLPLIVLSLCFCIMFIPILVEVFLLSLCMCLKVNVVFCIAVYDRQQEQRIRSMKMTLTCRLTLTPLFHAWYDWLLTLLLACGLSTI